MTLELIRPAAPPPSRFDRLIPEAPPSAFMAGCLAAARRGCRVNGGLLDAPIREIIALAYGQVSFEEEGGAAAFFESFFDLIYCSYEECSVAQNSVACGIQPALFADLCAIGYEIYRFFNRFSFSNDPWVCAELGLLLVIEKYNTESNFDFDIEETRLKTCWLDLVSKSIEQREPFSGDFTPVFIQDELLTGFINGVKANPLGYSTKIDVLSVWASSLIFDIVMETLGPWPTNKQFPVLGYLLAKELVVSLTRVWKETVIEHGRLLLMISRRGESDVVRYLEVDGNRALDISVLASKLLFKRTKTPNMLTTHNVSITHLTKEVYQRYVYALPK